MKQASTGGGHGGWACQVSSQPAAQVTAILVQHGLPRLLTGSILAHEVMHAWLRYRHVRELSLDVEEGLCQLMASLWLESQQAAAEQVQGTTEQSLGFAGKAGSHQAQAFVQGTEKL